MATSKAQIHNHRAYGAAIVMRLSNSTIPSAMKASAKAFVSAHKALEAGYERVDEARTAHDEALEIIGQRDDVLDKAVLTLADKMASSGLGTRRKPFAQFTKYPPSKLVEQAYADEVSAVRAMLTKITKVKAPKEITKSAADCAKAANEVEKALAALTNRQSDYSEALGARNTRLLAWQKALTQLRKYAAVAWIDKPEKYKAVFAPPNAVVNPVKRRAKKKTAAPTANGSKEPA